MSLAQLVHVLGLIEGLRAAVDLVKQGAQGGGALRHVLPPRRVVSHQLGVNGVSLLCRSSDYCAWITVPGLLCQERGTALEDISMRRWV